MGLSGSLTIESPVGAQITLAGRRYINFGGSSYLGLSGRPELLNAGMAGLRNGAGYQFARQYGIATQAHMDAEAQAAAYFGSATALYIASGYQFGSVAFTALRSRFSAIFIDEHAHHSLREAAAATQLPSHTFRHLDASDLAVQLKLHLPAKVRPLVVTDGMYSTLGEIAPLADYAHIVAAYDGRLLVDESHGFGVLGASGRGASEHHNVAASAVLIGGSTSKGLGVVGGIIPASHEEVDTLRATPAARSASAGLPAAAAMCAASLLYVREHPELLQQLRSNTVYLKSRLRQIGLPIYDSMTPVAAFTVGTHESMQGLQARLMSEGIYVLHSNYIGAGPEGVIRCGIFADHTYEHLDGCVDALRRLL